MPHLDDGTVRSSYYRYRLSSADEPFARIAEGRSICRVDEAFVGHGAARLAARIWYAVRLARPRTIVDASPVPNAFVLRIMSSGLHPASNLKALIDGATAAMQRAEPRLLRTEVARLAALLHVDEERLATLIAAPGAPLGTARHLFTIDGPEQVRTTPDDTGCVAAEVIASGEEGPVRLSVEVFDASAR